MIVAVVAAAAVRATMAQTAPNGDQRKLREIAASHPAAALLLETADQLEAIAKDTSPDASTLASFRRADQDLGSAQAGLKDAQSVLGTAERDARFLRDADPLLREYRASRTRSDSADACRAIYRIDPDSFVSTLDACREHYRAGGMFDQRLGAVNAGIALVKDLLPAARSRVAALERNVEKTASSFDDLVRGRLPAFKVIGIAAASTIILLALLVFGHASVGAMVFKDVHATELVTLILIVMAVIYFGSISFLKGDAVAGLLGAIAGYVLGRQSQSRGVQDERKLPELGTGQQGQAAAVKGQQGPPAGGTV